MQNTMCRILRLVESGIFMGFNGIYIYIQHVDLLILCGFV